MSFEEKRDIIKSYGDTQGWACLTCEQEPGVKRRFNTRSGAVKHIDRNHNELRMLKTFRCAFCHGVKTSQHCLKKHIYKRECPGIDINEKDQDIWKKS